jgi:hypothetical protein
VRCVADWVIVRVHPACLVRRLANRCNCPEVLALRTACLRGRGPLVPVGEATYPTMGMYGGGACGALVHGTSKWRVLVNPEMRPIPMVISQVLAEQPPKMLVAENDDVVEQGPWPVTGNLRVTWTRAATKKPLSPGGNRL